MKTYIKCNHSSIKHICSHQQVTYTLPTYHLSVGLVRVLVVAASASGLIYLSVCPRPRFANPPSPSLTASVTNNSRPISPSVRPRHPTCCPWTQIQSSHNFLCFPFPFPSTSSSRRHTIRRQHGMANTTKSNDDDDEQHQSVTIIADPSACCPRLRLRLRRA
ncbi:hypothetical protein BKA80DRAFT_31892 [Phyllosticta citrichinensis]